MSSITFYFVGQICCHLDLCSGGKQNNFKGHTLDTPALMTNYMMLLVFAKFMTTTEELRRRGQQSVVLLAFKTTLWIEYDLPQPWNRFCKRISTLRESHCSIPPKQPWRRPTATELLARSGPHPFWAILKLNQATFVLQQPNTPFLLGAQQSKRGLVKRQDSGRENAFPAHARVNESSADA